MTIIRLCGQLLKISAPVIAADTIDYLEMAVEMSSDWARMDSVLVRFELGETLIEAAVIDGRINKSQHINLERGVWRVSAAGLRIEDGQTVERITSTTASLTVHRTGGDGTIPPTPVEPSIVETILAEAKSAKTIAAEVQKRADDGEFDGKDGYSPSAKVERTDDGAIITITDKSGTTTAKVNDGQGGGSSVTDEHIKEVAETETIKAALANKADKSEIPSVPTALSQLTADSTHRLVTDAEKSAWNSKSNFSGSYNDLVNKPTIPEAVTDSHIKEVAETENIKSALEGKADKSEIPDVPVDDVQINGTTIVADGVANIPYASTTTVGVLAVPDWSGIGVFPNGNIYTVQAQLTDFQKRNTTVSYRVVTPRNIDLAVKLAMCDGKGAAWTEAEQLAAQARLGIISSEGVGF